MAGFRIFGRVEKLGQSGYFVIAAANPDRPSDEDRAIVLTRTATSLPEANAERRTLMAKVDEAVRARGDTVISVE